MIRKPARFAGHSADRMIRTASLELPTIQTIRRSLLFAALSASWLFLTHRGSILSFASLAGLSSSTSVVIAPLLQVEPGWPGSAHSIDGKVRPSVRECDPRATEEP